MERKQKWEAGAIAEEVGAQWKFSSVQQSLSALLLPTIFAVTILPMIAMKHFGHVSRNPSAENRLTSVPATAVDVHSGLMHLTASAPIGSTHLTIRAEVRMQIA